MRESTWERAADGLYRCLRHGTTFGPLSSCSECHGDPGPAPDAESDAPIAAPDGCLSTIELEQKLVSLAGLAEKEARKLSSNKSRVSSSAAERWTLTAIRAYGRALMLAERREDNERVERRFREIKRRDGVH